MRFGIMNLRVPLSVSPNRFGEGALGLEGRVAEESRSTSFEKAQEC